MVEGIQKILIQYTAGTWFKSSSAAKDIQILNVEYSWAHVYQLQCYNQMRQVKERCRGKSMISEDWNLEAEPFELVLFDSNSNSNSSTG